MRIFLVLALVVALLAIVFALQNAGVVIVTIGIWRITASLALILLLTLGLGLISGLLISMPAIIQRNWKINRYKRQVNQLEADLQETKQDLIHHQHLLAQAEAEPSKQEAWVEDQALPGADPQPLLSGTADPDEAAFADEPEGWP